MRLFGDSVLIEEKSFKVCLGSILIFELDREGRFVEELEKEGFDIGGRIGECGV